MPPSAFMSLKMISSRKKPYKEKCISSKQAHSKITSEPLVLFSHVLSTKKKLSVNISTNSSTNQLKINGIGPFENTDLLTNNDTTNDVATENIAISIKRS
jgi:hypothetical protein